jgi:hypothetical protein
MPTAPSTIFWRAEMIAVACWWGHRSLARRAGAERPAAIAV